MQPAIFSSFDPAIPFSRAIEMIHASGFTVISLDANHSGCQTAAGRTAIRRLTRQRGITIDSVHAPYPEGDQLFSLDEAERIESIRKCQIALDAAAELDSRIVVIHLIQPYGIPEGEIRDNMIEHGRKSVSLLASYADSRGVKLALENGQKRDYDQVLKHFLAEFDTTHVGFCYDSGHENVQGSCFNLLEELGHRLFAVHIHDNEGSDTHMLPYEGTIDWDRFRNIFHTIDFSGSLLLEVHMEHSRFKDHAVFLSEAKKRADKLLQHPGESQQ